MRFNSLWNCLDPKIIFRIIINSLSRARILRYILDSLLFFLYFFSFGCLCQGRSLFTFLSVPPTGRQHRHSRHHCHRHRLLIYVRVPKVLFLLCVVRGSAHWVFGCVPSRNLPGTIRFYWAADLHTALQFNFGPRRGKSCAEFVGGRATLASLITSNKTLCRTRAGIRNGNLIFTRRHLGKSITKYK